MSSSISLCRCLGWLLTSLFPALGLSIAAAQAQDFPKKAVRIISTGPGGSSDTLARVLASELSEVWGHPVIVENKAGAGGIVSTVAAAKATPDGYTVLINTSAFVVSAETSLKPVYDPIKDFTPVALLGKGPLLLVARPQLPANTLPQLLALARQKPDAITYASTGNGGITHLSAALLFQEATVHLRHIPFRSGNQATANVVGGHIDVYLGSMSASLPLVRNSSLKALAVTSLKRSVFAPDIPTAVEGGLANFSLELWWAILAPARTPQSAVNEINRQINTALEKARVREFLAKEGVEAAPMTPEQVGKFLREEQGRWKKVVEESKFEKQ